MKFGETHQLFHVPELVSIVCEHVRRDSDLKRLARTSSVFLEPALNVLWRERYSFAAFVRCFPASLWEHSEEKGSLKFRRAIEPDDWTRFHFYAKRARSLVVPDFRFKQDRRVDATVFRELEVASFGQCLFPNLRSFEVQLGMEESSFSWTMLNLFLGSQLNELILNFGFKKQRTGSFLYHLHLRCPDIKKLAIDCSFELHLRKAITGPLFHYGNLSELTLPCLPTNEGMSQIAKLDSLVALKIEASYLDEEYPHFTIDCAPFPRLEYLDLSAEPDLCRDFLKATVGSPLRFISLEINLNHEPLGAESRASIYASAQAHNTLVQLCIWEATYYNSFNFPLRPTRMEDIQGLLTLTHLEHFILRLGGGMDFDDNDIRKIAEAFPNLEILRLGSRNMPICEPFPCRVTLTGVTSLIELCTGLEEINLQFDATAVPDGPPDDVFNDSIPIIHVDDCPISAASVPKVAEYLHRLLPELEIDFEGDVDDEEEDHVDQEIVSNWRDVRKRLDELQEALDELE